MNHRYGLKPTTHHSILMATFTLIMSPLSTLFGTTFPFYGNLILLLVRVKQRLWLDQAAVVSLSMNISLLIGFFVERIGKSTCVSLLLRFYEPSSGQITINGRSIANENIKQLRENIGVVSQEPVCFFLSLFHESR